MKSQLAGITITGLPDTMGLLLAIAALLLVLGVAWFVVKTTFKLAMKIFWSGILLILCLGAFLVMAAFLIPGG